jgi:predicted Zn-dependent protease
LFLAGKIDEAQEIFDGLVDEFPDRLSIRGTRGFIAASRGDTEQATEDAEWLEQVDEPFLFGEHTAARAMIASALGQPDVAVQLLRQAFSQGQPYVLGIESSFEFEPLRDYPPFQILCKPKG